MLYRTQAKMIQIRHLSYPLIFYVYQVFYTHPLIIYIILYLNMFQFYVK